MFKKYVSTIVIAVLFILSIGYPKSVMASEGRKPTAKNEKLFNIKASDTKWIDDENIHSEPGHWELMEEYEKPSYVIESNIARYDGFDYENVEFIGCVVTIGSAVEISYNASCPNLVAARQAMNDNYFSEYSKKPAEIKDCSDRGYPQLYYGKCKGNKNEYFDSAEMFYGKAKGYFIVVNYSAGMEKSDSVSEEWFTKMFYSWLDKIPSNEATNRTNILHSSYFKVGIISVVSLAVIAGVTVGIILITQKSKKRKNQSNNSIPQVGGMPGDLQGIDNQFKYCTSCGNKTESDSKFCSKCGTLID